MNKAINDYFTICELCNDRVELVAVLIQIVNIQPHTVVMKSLQTLSVAKFEKEFDTILEDVDLHTLKNLITLLDKKIEEVKEDENINDCSNLFDFME